MDDDELDRHEDWLCALAVRCCRADDVPTPLPDELLSLLRTPLAPWSLLECAADAAEALTAQASNAPAAERRARLQPLWQRLAPALLVALRRRPATGGDAAAARQGCLRAALRALAVLLDSAEVKHGEPSWPVEELGALLPTLSPWCDAVLLPAAAVLRGVCAHADGRTALCAHGGTARLLRRCLHAPDAATRARGRAASCLLHLHRVHTGASPQPSPAPPAVSDAWRVLLAPIEPAVFLREHWERAFLHLPRPEGAAGAKRDALCASLLRQLEPSCLPPHLPRLPPPPPAALGSAAAHAGWLLSQLESSGRGAGVGLGGAARIGDDVTLVRAAADGASALRLGAEGAAAEPTHVTSAVRAGFTRAVCCAQWRCAATAAVAAAVEAAVGAPVNANLYETPPAERGLERHYDDHCVIALQLAGSKVWHLSCPAPARALPPLHAPRDAPLVATNRWLRVEMRRGDVLYVPRGVVHRCEAGGDGSRHLTLGVEVEAPLEWHGLLQLLLCHRHRAAAPTTATAVTRRLVAPLPGGVRGQLQRRNKRRRGAEDAEVAPHGTWRWVELVRCALLVARETTPPLRALVPRACEPRELLPQARALLREAGAAVATTGTAARGGAWRRLESGALRSELEWLEDAQQPRWQGRHGHTQPPPPEEEEEEAAEKEEEVLRELLCTMAEVLDVRWLAAARGAQIGLLQRICEARAVTAEAFRTATGASVHAWQGRGV